MLRTAIPLLVATLSSAACTLNTQGIPAPATCPGPIVFGTDPSIACHVFHYPIAAALSSDSNFLYVVNSDFNLEYNGGRVNVVNVGPTITTTDGTVWQGLASAIGPRPADGALPWPTDAMPVYEQPFIEAGASVTVNPFATSAALRTVPILGGSQERLYVTVRGDGTLTWMDLPTHDGTLASGAPEQYPTLLCNADAVSGLCDEPHRVGHDPATSGDRGLILPPLPDSSSIDADGAIAIAHQETPLARGSLMVDFPGSNVVPTTPTAPLLAFWVTNLPGDLDAVFRVNPPVINPITGVASPPWSNPNDPPHWYFLSRQTPEIAHVRMQIDPQTPDLSYNWVAHVDTIQGMNSDAGLYAMILDPCDPTRAFATARSYATAQSATATPLSADQLIEFDITDPDYPLVTDVLELPPGPESLVAVPPAAGCGTGDDTLVYVVLYNSQKLYVIDVDLDPLQPVDEVLTQRGPHVPVFDASRGLMYLIDFASMVIEVIDVRQHSPTWDQRIFTLGIPIPPVMM